MDPDDLERLIDGELKRLPAPHAPGTLLPRVLAATRAQVPAAWYTRPWFAWPRGWQAVSVAAVVALAAGLALVAGPARDAALALVSPCGPGLEPCATGGRLGFVVTLAGSVREASTLVRLFWQVVLVPVGYWLMGVAVLLSLACGAVWIVLDRIVLGEAPQS
jgi:hypothetical protein